MDIFLQLLILGLYSLAELRVYPLKNIFHKETKFNSYCPISFEKKNI